MKKKAKWSTRTRNDREQLGEQCYLEAKQAKDPYTQEMIRLNRYYKGEVYSQEQFMAFAESIGMPIEPPVLPDARIQVESQIDCQIPEFVFRGRDESMDKRKAEIRQDVVQFICDNNQLEMLNIENERNLNKYGNAFWKVAFDGTVKGMGYVGDIAIGNPSPANIFPDPTAYEVEDCEYIIYSYRIHRRRARRIWGKVIDDLKSDHNHQDTEIFAADEASVGTGFDSFGARYQTDQDTMQVNEFWYRDEEGDIACSVQIDNHEVQYIPKYWKNTRHSGNQLYPFVKYGKTPVEQSFWDEGEIAPIVSLIDAENREAMTMLANHMLMANDIVLAEEGAFAEDFEPDNTPGTIWKLKANKMGRVQRMGGLNQNSGFLNVVSFLHDKIEETNGNFQSRNGLEPSKMTTFKGLHELNSRADSRLEVKKTGRRQGFRKLFQLIDWTALEFYNSDRLVLIRGTNEGEEDTQVYYNSDHLKVYDADTNRYYYPVTDVEIITGKGTEKSPELMMENLEKLAGMEILPENAPMIKAIVRLLALPNASEIIAHIDKISEEKQGAGTGQGMTDMLGGAMMTGSGTAAEGMPQGDTEPIGLDEVVKGLSEEELLKLQALDDGQLLELLQQIGM